ncbi:hypothetical protein [Glycomyces tenuis]|uniref:hypothetical protein n=1 Tax=Glycomyces tenuis TaxID=58116 RepID=UPI0004260D44|nr:hypothetical protein [Glycomyces tenuis]
MSTETTGRVRLRAAVHITPVEGGLYCVGWQETLKISGSPALGKLWTALFPHLHRGADPEALTAALPPQARETARRLLDELLDKGFLRPELPGRAAADEASLHPDHRRTLSFLDSAVEDPHAAFDRLRSHPIAIHGEGPLAEAAARCLLSLGAGRLSVSEPSAALKEHAAETGAELGPLGGGGAPVRIHIDTPEPSAEAAAVIGVAQLSDRAVIAPPRRGEDEAGLATVLERMRARGVDTASAPVPDVAAALAGNLAAMQAFYLLTGVSTEYDGQAYQVMAERLQTTTHPVWARGEAPALPVGSERPAATDPGRIAELCDPVTGLLPDAGPGELPQMPMAVASAGPDSFGWGETGDVARYRAALDGARALAGAAPSEGLWPLDGDRPLPVSTEVTCAGVDEDRMLCDATVRLLASWLDDAAERERRFESAGVETVEVEAFERAAALDVETLRPLRAPGLTAASVAAGGRRLAVFAHPDGETARRVAIRHAAAALQAGGERPTVPVTAVPPDSPHAEDAAAWNAREALASLPEAGERIAVARCAAEPGLDALGAVGWLGVHRSGGSR